MRVAKSRQYADSSARSSAVRGERVEAARVDVQPNDRRRTCDAVGAGAGGPLTVVPTTGHHPGGDKSSSEWQLVEPRILACVGLSTEGDVDLFGGQRGFATLYVPDFTVASRIHRLTFEWLDRLRRRSNRE